MKKLILVALLLLSSVVTSQATTITFDSLEQAGSGYQFMPTYSENGFQLTSGNFGSAQQGNSDWYLGSASLFNNSGNGVTTLTKIGGGTFDFDSVDLAPVSKYYGSGAAVSFIGKLHDGGTVTASYTLNDSYSFQTFVLSGFDKLDSVTWEQTYNYHQFDNLVLDQSAPVPEPGTMALLSIGMVGLAIYGKRRKNNKAQHINS